MRLREGTPLRRDGIETVTRMKQIVSLGEPILRDTNLTVEGAPIGEKEVDLVRELVQTVSPVNKDNYKLHQHIQDAEKMAETFTHALQETSIEEFNDLNRNKIRIGALLHDFGRFTNHRFLRNELIEVVELRNLGLRKDIQSMLPPLQAYMRKDPNNEVQVQETFDNLTTEQRIIELADICSKRKDDGTFQTFDEIMEYHARSRSNYKALTGVEELWPSENTKNDDFIQFSTKVYRKIEKWARQKGLDLERLQESILEREVNSPIKAVLFDVGSVLVADPEKDVIDYIATRFHLSQTEAEYALGEVNSEIQTGSTEENNYASIYEKALGHPITNDDVLKFTALLRTGRDPMYDKVIADLKARGYVLAIHSDTNPQHQRVFDQAGAYEGFDTKVFSYDIKTTKKSPDAFKISALRLWLPIQSIFFIDDKPEYVAAFRTAGGKRSIVHTSIDATTQQLDQLPLAA